MLSVHVAGHSQFASLYGGSRGVFRPRPLCSRFCYNISAALFPPSDDGLRKSHFSHYELDCIVIRRLDTRKSPDDDDPPLWAAAKSERITRHAISLTPPRTTVKLLLKRNIIPSSASLVTSLYVA
ncbi:hypothetical protein B0H16DRAFT_1465802 [Mycena metata]|uniref:Uncharacterized protein n=1 Tax=Mycena metata TaxID=1033252 RepID=A0AAD7N048_9AGAR|nr:hypothetical protein B0H16DRAFT_1465802 [Mycena metata]